MGVGGIGVVVGRGVAVRVGVGGCVGVWVGAAVGVGEGIGVWVGAGVGVGVRGTIGLGPQAVSNAAASSAKEIQKRLLFISSSLSFLPGASIPTAISQCSTGNQQPPNRV